MAHSRSEVLPELAYVYMDEKQSEQRGRSDNTEVRVRFFISQDRHGPWPSSSPQAVRPALHVDLYVDVVMSGHL